METDELLKRGIAALRSGNRLEARKLLIEVVRIDSRNETAWLWLSGTVDTDRERQVCLERVLAINPQNAVARREFAALKRRLGSDVDNGKGHKHNFVREGVKSTVCPKCGTVNPEGAMNCQNCRINLEWALQNPEYFAKEPTVRCPNCGTINLGEATNCKVCGVNFEWAKEHIKRKCPTCGADNSREATNCQVCNTRLDWETQEEVKMKAEKPWYRSSGFYALAFFFITPIWVLLILSDENQSGWVKAIAVIILLINIAVCLIAVSGR